MALRFFKSQREKRIVPNLTQLDPAFYKKIISRSFSIRRHSIQGFSSRYSGGVPFNWEIQPGKPKNVAELENPHLTNFPPSIYSLSMSRSYARNLPNIITKTRTKGNFLKNIKKVKKIKNIEIGLPNANTKGAKAYILKNIKNVKKIKNIKIGLPISNVTTTSNVAKGSFLKNIKKVKKINFRKKKMKVKSPEIKDAD